MLRIFFFVILIISLFKVQELLTKFINSDLGKNLNTDESAAMGAVYKAADLSSGFKVIILTAKMA